MQGGIIRIIAGTKKEQDVIRPKIGGKSCWKTKKEVGGCEMVWNDLIWKLLVYFGGVIL